MLVPPSSSDLLSSKSCRLVVSVFRADLIPAIDTTKLNKPRQFARSAAPARDVDNSLWTETPAERQQRLADEVAGKRRRAVNADPDAGDEEKEAEIRKRRKRDEDIRRGVEEHTVGQLFLLCCRLLTQDVVYYFRGRTVVAHCWSNMQRQLPK